MYAGRIVGVILMLLLFVYLYMFFGMKGKCSLVDSILSPQSQDHALIPRSGEAFCLFSKTHYFVSFHSGQ